MITRPCRRIVRDLVIGCAAGLASVLGVGCRDREPPPPAAAAGVPTFHPVATVAEVMEALVLPASSSIFNAAVWENGVSVGAPRNDEEWETVHHQALMLAEAGNLLMMAPRAKDDKQWITLSRGLVDKSIEAAKAAETKDVEVVFVAGAHLHAVCDTCHKQYVKPMADAAP